MASDYSYYKMLYTEALNNLQSQKEGLSQEQAQHRLKQYGANEIQEEKRRTLLEMFLSQFRDVMVIILMAAAIISGLLGEITDSLIILIVIIINAVLGMIQESKAEKALSELKKMSSPYSKVKRNGEVTVIKTAEIVPGDIVVLEAGDYVPADLRIIESVNLKVDESALTGESIAVEKHCDKIDGDDVAIGDRKNMAYLASSVTYGRGEGITVKTGMDTEVGKIAAYISVENSDETPLQKKLAEMGKYLSVIIIAVSSLIFIVGLLWGKGIADMFLTAISLAVAAIPEGLPAVVTIVLALGVQRMAKRNAIVRKLPAVETLGSTGIICSDKTGTLTQNRMTVTDVYINNTLFDAHDVKADSFEAEMLFKAATLCNDSKVSNSFEKSSSAKAILGDPTEVALIYFSHKFGNNKNQMEKQFCRCAEIPFDSERKLMTTVNKIQNNYTVLTKGAVDTILSRCNKILINGMQVTLDDEKIQTVLENNKLMADKALRVLGFAYKQIDELPSKMLSDDIEKNLTFVGLLGMIDPPREEVKEAVKICRQAGIRPIMITGDHKFTAVAIAKQLDILCDDSEVITGAELDKITDEEFKQLVTKYSVYARVSPEHKVRIVNAWKYSGQIVAMTGDGVNDAPAIKSADIGIGMGITGTDVAKGVSDMVLSDDNFATIVQAVKEGRRIFRNIRICVQFLLSCNFSEVLTIFIATLFNWDILYPIHILWINLVTDTFPALALGVEKESNDIMKKNPLGINQSIFSNGVGIKVIVHGIFLTAITLCAFLTTRSLFGHDTATTVAFITMGFVQLFHALNVRSNSKTVFDKSLLPNKYLILSIAASALMQSVVVLIPSLNSVFKVEHISIQQWGIAIGFSLLIIPVIEISKLLDRYWHKSRNNDKL